MESILSAIVKESSAVKFAPIKAASSEALEFLQDERQVASIPTYQLRDKCLHPLQLALESRNSKLTSYGIGGMQKMIDDSRFHSSIVHECDDNWLPLQVLQAVVATPNLPEESQVEVMKVLLSMTFSSVWCANAKIITKIAELCLNCFLSSNRQYLRYVCLTTLSQIVGGCYGRHTVKELPIEFNFDKKWSETLESWPRRRPPWVSFQKLIMVCLETFNTSSQSVRTAIRATLTQMLSSIAEKLYETQTSMGDSSDEDDEVMEDGAKQQKDLAASNALCKDVVDIMCFLCEKLRSTQCVQQHKPLVPLLLEGIYSILKNLPTSVRDSPEFVELLWKQLCPGLISMLGNPVTDKSVVQKPAYGSQDGRGSGCSTNAPNVAEHSAKTIYNIAVELVKIVGSLRSLRPVLESVFHRMLLYPPPQHRLEAIRILKEVLSSPEGLLSLAGPTMADDSAKCPGNKLSQSNIALLKLVVDSVQECCHCNESSVCITSVQCMDELLKSLEQVVQGEHLPQDVVDGILEQFDPPDMMSSVSECEDTLESSQETTMSAEAKIDHLKTIIDSVHAKHREQEENEVFDSDAEEPSDLNKGHDLGDRKLSSGCYTQEAREEDYKSRFPMEDFHSMEKQSAKDYVVCLLQVLPSLLDIPSISELDETLQTFASNFCTGQRSSNAKADESGNNNACKVILNADGVYMATYSTLLLNLKLLKSGYYSNKDQKVLVTEVEFVNDILDSELLLYLSDTWLSEVYRQTLSLNLLQMAGFAETIHKNNPLINVLTDIDGLCSLQLGGQLLREYKEEEENENQDMIKRRSIEAGMKFAKAVLMLCWDGILDVLSVLLDGKSSCGITSSLSLMLGTEGAKEESKRAQEAICMSLDGLQRAARLACMLGLQMRCGTVFAQLASASCVMEETKRSPIPDRKTTKMPVLVSKPKLPRLHAAHALSLDVVLTTGLEMGSHSKDCWAHVFRSCAHISQLEHTYFSRGNNQSNLPKIHPQGHPMEMNNEDEESHEYYGIPVVPMVPVAPSINVPELIKQSKLESGWDSAIVAGGVLNGAQTSKCLCGLSQAVDRLFEDAAYKLTMKSLIGFLAELSRSSSQQLYSLGRPNLEREEGAAGSNLPTNVLHLYRLGDVMLKCIKSGRPLMHIMRIWTTVSPHFVEAACHRDRRISKKAVACIHDCVTTLLSIRQELPHFHFNELLCKPFENLLCLELCDGDAQDQIVCSICELVEACTIEICSGWRPLFAALRAVKIEFTTNEEVNEARQRHVAAVLDVFEVFLNSDNILVFANAAIDCILCLLKYVRGPGEFESDFDDSDSGSDCLPAESTENLCIPALKYLKQCCEILSTMWNMPACPIFNGAHRIKMNSVPQCVDPMIPFMDLESFQRFFDQTPSQRGSIGSFVQSDWNKPMDMSLVTDLKTLSIAEHNNESLPSQDSGNFTLSPGSGENAADTLENQVDSEPKDETPKVERQRPENAEIHLSRTQTAQEGMCSKLQIQIQTKTLGEMDNHTGILHVWFLLLEGMATAVSTCPKTYQPQTLEMLFDLLRSSANTPGAEFGIYCINHLLLPMLQDWLRHCTKSYGYFEGSPANFKQCCGLCTDLVVEYIVQFAGTPETHSGTEFMLKQMMDVLVECIAQPVEAISRLGCSCVRHAILSSGPLLTENMWHIVTQSLHHAFNVTMYSTRQLMTLFHANSDNFYGDIGQVKVAARKDCSVTECERLRQLALQVFLLDSQRAKSPLAPAELEQDRTYVFLLYPPEFADSYNPEHIMTRVPFRSLVVGLLSHQLLLQTVGAILLEGTSNVATAEQHILQRRLSQDSEDLEAKDQGLPGMLNYLSSRNMLTILQCLQDSYRLAMDFDSRPGLKFLIQKVASSDVAANLYKQAGISMTFMVHTLIEVCMSNKVTSSEQVKEILRLHLEAKKEVTERFEKEFEELIREQGRTKTKDQVMPSPAYVISDLYSDMESARRSHGTISEHHAIFIKLLYECCNDICTTYTDLVLDKEGTATADRMSDRPLFFLVAQPDEIPELKREKALMTMVAEKLQEQQLQLQHQGPMATAQVPVQAQCPQDSYYDFLSNEQGSMVEHSETVSEYTQSMMSSRMSPLHSPDDDRIGKHNPEDKVYTVATDRTIKNLMSAYKKRKQQHSMPTFRRSKPSKPKVPKTRKSKNTDPIQEEIENEQTNSIMKDSEAHIQSWTEMICTLLNLIHQVADESHQLLLPVVFPSLNQLVCHAEDVRLKEALAMWVHRLGYICGFAWRTANQS
ncbi:brefeldin A-inhibited guanine nucleotide-exchange protein 3-like isoform X3 [Lineus longissimus]|uniref:brefeldin A-inhibited guanine nucleotide-exchange protein 3-like isoform X3 n=1 Tax=Lineus longissimus TaxID=88925 RepID=UPI00315C72C3